MSYVLYQQRDNNIYTFSNELKVVKTLQHWLSKHHKVFSIILVKNKLINDKNFHTFKFNEALLGNIRWDVGEALSMSFINNAKFIKKIKTDEEPNKLDYIKINLTKKFLEEFLTFAEITKRKRTQDIEYFVKSLNISKDLIKCVIKDDPVVDKIFDDEIKQEQIVINAIDNVCYTVIEEIMNLDYHNITLKELTSIFNDISIFFKENGNRQNYVIYSKIYNEYYRSKD